MKIVRSPLRVSLFGGGSDLPAYYEKHGGLIISFAIDRCISLIHNDRPTGGCRLSYSKVEEVKNWREVEHDLVRAYAEYNHILLPATITIVGDVPKGTGLGSSSALSLALAMMYYKNPYDMKVHLPLWKVAKRFEEYTNPHVGIQDFLPAY
ncbi:MAG: hypothetical protein GF347_00625, partial [Candidatus Moranbacteria bacterium]|nr:hypothetical protein [Candidatus Moranbacteria bacterium]